MPKRLDRNHPPAGAQGLAGPTHSAPESLKTSTNPQVRSDQYGVVSEAPLDLKGDRSTSHVATTAHLYGGASGRYDAGELGQLLKLLRDMFEEAFGPGGTNGRGAWSLLSSSDGAVRGPLQNTHMRFHLAVQALRDATLELAETLPPVGRGEKFPNALDQVVLHIDQVNQGSAGAASVKLTQAADAVFALLDQALQLRTELKPQATLDRQTLLELFRDNGELD